jgi:hypothetical protein
MAVYGIWTGPSPKKYYMDLRSFGPYNIFLVTDRSIYCHMTLSAMNYLLYSLIFLIHNIDYLSISHYAWRHTYREYSVPVSVLVMTTGTCGQDPMLLPFFFLTSTFLHLNNILQLSMFTVWHIYNKYNQTVVSIHAGFLTWYKIYNKYNQTVVSDMI